MKIIFENANFKIIILIIWKLNVITIEVVIFQQDLSVAVGFPPCLSEQNLHLHNGPKRNSILGSELSTLLYGDHVCLYFLLLPTPKI